MAQSPEHQRFLNTYLDVVGRLGGDPFALRADEFSWRVRYVAEWNAIRLRLLTALQRALPTSQAEDKAAQELKETLTNVIIMQTRLREREEALVQQLEEAAQSGAMRSVTVDASDARSVDEQLLAAQKHLQEIASG